VHPSSALRDPSNTTPVQELTHLLRNMEPEVVYLHNPADAHETHVAAYLRSVAALRTLPREKRPSCVFGCEVWRSLDWLVSGDKIALSAGRRSHLQAALAGVFDTQIAGGKRYDLAVLGRRVANATFHEADAADRDSGLTFAVDLTSVVGDDEVDPVEFALDLVRRFETDVRERLRRVGGAR
jgi:LmbE family N-acetylglucosaminyl deacetylase